MEKEFDPRIERYFSDEMNEQERRMFEKELLTNSELQSDCKLYAIMIKGIQSEGLRQKQASSSNLFAERVALKSSLLAQGVYDPEKDVDEEKVATSKHIIMEHHADKANKHPPVEAFPLQRWLAAASVVLAVGIAALWFIGRPESGPITAQIVSKSPKNVQGFAGTGAVTTYTVAISSQQGQTLYSFSESRIEISGPDALSIFLPESMEILEWVSYGAKFVYLKNNETYYQLQEGAKQQPLQPSPRPDVLE